MTDTTRYKEWFNIARKDLSSAKILFQYDADYGIVCFHCQQAVEKYLKGYLIYKTGEIHEGHSLVKLCKKCMRYNKEFNVFLKDCAFLTAFYVETRYPAEDPLNVSREDTEECLDIANKIVGYIDKQLDDKEE